MDVLIARTTRGPIASLTPAPVLVDRLGARDGVMLVRARWLDCLEMVVGFNLAGL
jgi:hypothetical protein